MLEVFTSDAAVFGSSGPYPATQAMGSTRFLALGSIPAGRFELHSIRWDPSNDQLTVGLAPIS